MLRADDIIEAQRDLILRLDNQLVRQMVGFVTTSEWAERREMSREDQFEMYDGIGLALQRVARVAFAYQVTNDMTTLVTHAAASLDGTDRFQADMAPTGCGIVRFESPIVLHDTDGTEMHANWLVWGPPRTDIDPNAAITAFWFNDRKSNPDDLQQMLSRFAEERNRTDFLNQIGRWGPITMDIVGQDVRVGPAVVEQDEWQAARVAMNHGIGVSRENTARILMALWLLLNQTVVTTNEVQPSRATRRWAQRMNIPTGVTVVDLRRHESMEKQPSESPVEWSHRWITRGHWRWQAYGEGRKERRRIWINDFVKGPADKPLVVTDKLYRLRR